jgi:hypothetical protein
MARAKDRPAGAGKTAKSAGTKSRGPSPVQARKPAKPADPTPEQLYCMIQETAYFKAKARDFAPGHEVQDWIEAEAEVRRRMESRA